MSAPCTRQPASAAGVQIFLHGSDDRFDILRAVWNDQTADTEGLLAVYTASRNTASALA